MDIFVRLFHNSYDAYFSPTIQSSFRFLEYGTPHSSRNNNILLPNWSLCSFANVANGATTRQVYIWATLL